MAITGLEIEGFEDVIAQLEKLSDKMQNKFTSDAIKNAVKDNVLPDAIYSAPVLTGALVASMTEYRVRAKGVMGWKVTAAGKPDHGIERAPHAIFIEYGTEKMPAEPVLRPALDNNATTVINQVGREIGQAIEREFNKGE